VPDEDYLRRTPVGAITPNPNITLVTFSRVRLILDNRSKQRGTGDWLLKSIPTSRECPRRRESVLAQASSLFALLTRKSVISGLFLASCYGIHAQTPSPRQVHLVEVLADQDSQYKIVGLLKPRITVRAGEQILLRIRARRGRSWNRDGSVHGFALLRADDRSKVPGWDLQLRPGMQEFLMAAPEQVGEYLVVCTVMCGQDHDGMQMKLEVVP
jgi:hypothetical protein